MSFWRKFFGKKHLSGRSSAPRSSLPATAMRSSLSPGTTGSPTKACLACQRKFDALLTICPPCGSPEAMAADAPEWLMLLQAHVTAVQSNDTAVRLFREGRLDEAIGELHRGLEANPPYATGYSDLGFLYLCKGQLDQAIDCLLRALEVDPHHKDAPDHLFDVLGALIDELVQIGFSDGFLSTQPGAKFDDHNRHMRTRAIGALIVKMGERGIFTAECRVLESTQLMAIVINNVQKKMAYHRNSTTLQYAWDGTGGWYPRVVIPISHHTVDSRMKLLDDSPSLHATASLPASAAAAPRFVSTDSATGNASDA
jgi:Tetratricopeptide repeat